MNTGNVQLESQIQQLISDVTAEKTAVDGAAVIIRGIPDLLGKAIADAQANGVTDEQIASLSNLHLQLMGTQQELTAAVMAGTTASVPASA